jgi:hypothetical protein
MFDLMLHARRPHSRLNGFTTRLPHLSALWRGPPLTCGWQSVAAPYGLLPLAGSLNACTWGYILAGRFDAAVSMAQPLSSESVLQA